MLSIRHRFAQRCTRPPAPHDGKRLPADRRASMAILASATLPVLVGGAAMVIDLAHAYSQRASLQQVADSAALAGALAYIATAQTSVVQATVQDVVTANGWPSSVIQNAASEYLTQSPQNAANTAVQVSLTTTNTSWFGAALLSGGGIATGVTALAEMTTRPYCVLSLNTLQVNGTLNTGSCGVAADSSNTGAVTVNGGGSLTAGVISAYGTIVNNGTISGAQKTGTTVADPYQTYQSAASSGFSNCHSYNNQSTLTAGCWSNVVVNSGNTLTLQAGTYFFTNINVNSNATLTGTGGVTIVLQNNFSPSGNITITAPTSGSWAGMAIYAAGGLNINSGVTYTVNGAIYSPTTALNLNSATWNQNACTYIVAQSLTLNGGALLTLPQNNCSNYGYPTAATTIASLTQ